MPSDNEFRKKEFQNPIPTTDIIIEYVDASGKQGIVLIDRKNRPLGIALPGGFAEKGLTYAENAIKEGKEETGLTLTIQRPEFPFMVVSDPDRDPRDHVTSTIYVAQGHGTIEAGDDAASAKLYTIDEIIQMLKKHKETHVFAADHAHILTEYLRSKGHNL